MEIKPLFDVGQVFVKWLGIGNNIFNPTNEDTSQSITIKRTGTFFITLNLNISNARDRGFGVHFLLKRKGLNWTVFRRIVIGYSGSVFYTCLISLKTGDSISILRNIALNSLISSMEIQYLTSSKQTKGGAFSIYMKPYHSFIRTSVLVDINETVKSQDGSIKITHSGTYMIILNLEFCQTTPRRIFIVSLLLKKKKKQKKIYEMKKKNTEAANLAFYMNCLQYLESGDEIFLSLHHESAFQLTNGDISFLLIGSDKGQLLSQSYQGLSESIENGKIHWGYDINNPLFPVYGDVTTKKTLFCLLSTVITGQITFEKEKDQFIQVSVRLNEEKIHNLQVRYTNFSQEEFVSLTLSGMIMLYEEDVVAVHIELSSGARISLTKHVKLQLAVLDQFYSGLDDISIFRPAVLESSIFSTGNLLEIISYLKRLSLTKKS